MDDEARKSPVGALMLQYRKAGWSALLVALLVMTQVAPLRSALFGNPLFAGADAVAVEYLDRAFTRALAAFALARATNAVISVVQETEVQLSPAGVGVTLGVGQALDPVNDLVERFSWVMLVSLASLGIQKALLEIAPWVSVELLLSLSLTLFLLALWCPARFSPGTRRMAQRLLLAALVVRFCLPLVAWANGQVYTHFLEPRYAAASATLEQQTLALEQQPLQEMPEAEPGGFWQRFRQQADEALDLRAQIEGVKAKAAQMVNDVISLIVVFVLETVLLPLLFLWMVVRLARGIRVAGPWSEVEQRLRERMSGGTG